MKPHGNRTRDLTLRSKEHCYCATAVVRVVELWIDTALVVCLNSVSAALVIAASASDTRSVEVVDLGMS